MAKKVSASYAKARLSALMAEVGCGGKRVLIERRGKPAAALVSVSDLERLEQGQARSERPLGALAIVGAWKDVGDEAIDALVSDIYDKR